MFSSPSKRVSCGDMEIRVRYLVPPRVIMEALTDARSAQVDLLLVWLDSVSTTHSRCAESSLSWVASTFSLTEACRDSSPLSCVLRLLVTSSPRTRLR